MVHQCFTLPLARLLEQHAAIGHNHNKTFSSLQWKSLLQCTVHHYWTTSYIIIITQCSPSFTNTSMVHNITHISMEHSPTPAHGSLAHTLYSAALHQHMVPSLLATPSYICLYFACSHSTLELKHTAGQHLLLEGVSRQLRYDICKVHCIARTYHISSVRYNQL